MRRGTVYVRYRRVKRYAGGGLATALRLLARTRPPAGLAVYYHGLSHDQDRGDVLVPEVVSALFRRQVEHLARHYDVVPAVELPQATAEWHRGRPRPVAITFD